MTDRERDGLSAIVDSADLIADYLAEAGDDWASEQHWIDALAKRVEEIGEQAKRISEETLGQIPRVDWRSVKGMRDQLSHDYGDIDLDILREVVTDLMHELRTAVAQYLESTSA